MEVSCACPKALTLYHNEKEYLHLFHHFSVKFDENESLDQSLTVSCYNVVASDVREEFCSPNILDCELAVPIIPLRLLPCYQTAIHVLACLDMLAQARSSKDALKSFFTEQKRVVNTRSLRKEDFSYVNRFQGNVWREIMLAFILS